MNLTFTDDQYTTMATNIIREYKNYPSTVTVTDTDIQVAYALAIPLIVKNIQDSLSINKSTTSEKQGNRSATYKENIVIIDDSIRLLLGKPYVCFY